MFLLQKLFCVDIYCKPCIFLFFQLSFSLFKGIFLSWHENFLRDKIIQSALFVSVLMVSKFLNSLIVVIFDFKPFTCAYEKTHSNPNNPSSKTSSNALKRVWPWKRAQKPNSWTYNVVEEETSKKTVRHVTGNDEDYLRKIPRVVW